jgi:hypothetical protein
MEMWKQLQDLLTSPKSSPNIRKQTLWVIGTAIQNSPEAQNAASSKPSMSSCNMSDHYSAQYLELKPIPAILSFLGANNAPKIRSKAAYALSGLLKHNKAAADNLGAAGGWDVLRTALDGGSTLLLVLPSLIVFLFMAQTHR